MFMRFSIAWPTALQIQGLIGCCTRLVRATDDFFAMVMTTIQVVTAGRSYRNRTKSRFAMAIFSSGMSSGESKGFAKADP